MRRDFAPVGHLGQRWRAALAAIGPALFVGVAFAGALCLAPAPAAAYGWFWGVVPPAIGEDGRAQRAGAMSVVRDANNRGVGRFGSAAMARRIALQYRQEIDRAARRARVSEALLIAIVMVESGGNPGAVSPAGAQGLAQLMPGTARRYGVRNVFDPNQNLQGGAAYLSDLLKLYGDDMILALAAYNSGEHTVSRYRGVPPFAETRAYVPRVLSAFLTASELCRRPPRSARRRCALAR